MPAPRPSSRLPAPAVRAFEKIENRNWEGGVPLADLLGMVNRVAVRFPPAEAGRRDSRVSRLFTPRSFRHYQTLGCIDPPEKDGHRALYGVRHFIQALLVRRLLWERVPSGRIAVLMAGRGTEETKRMLFEGVEIVVRQGAGEGSSTALDPVETWKRVGVVPGIELHLRDDLPKPGPAELANLLAQLETALRKNL